MKKNQRVYPKTWNIVSSGIAIIRLLLFSVWFRKQRGYHIYFSKTRPRIDPFVVELLFEYWWNPNRTSLENFHSSVHFRKPKDDWKSQWLSINYIMFPRNYEVLPSNYVSKENGYSIKNRLFAFPSKVDLTLPNSVGFFHKPNLTRNGKKKFLTTKINL